MKVLLIKDVYKLGRAGDVKKVADGFGRNFLLPQKLAVLVSPGAMRQVETIRAKASAQRVVINNELGGIAEQINGMNLAFPSKASETGKLYGSISPQIIAEAINDRLGTKIDRHQVEGQPIRTLGEHKAHIRLTVDLNPVVNIVVYREGETPASPAQTAKQPAAPEEKAG